MTTNRKMRGQALYDGKPNLTVLAPGAVNSAVPGPGCPVPKGTRGTEYRDRNPMHDTVPDGQDEGRKDPIRSQARQRGIR